MPTELNLDKKVKCKSIATNVLINIIVPNKHFMLYFFSYLDVQSGRSLDFQYCTIVKNTNWHLPTPSGNTTEQEQLLKSVFPHKKTYLLEKLRDKVLENQNQN